VRLGQCFLYNTLIAGRTLPLGHFSGQGQYQNTGKLHRCIENNLG
jgi:hypothetical protein